MNERITNLLIVHFQQLHNVAGQHATLIVMAFILRRAQKNIEHSLKRPVFESFDAPIRNANEEFAQLYREALSKV